MIIVNQSLKDQIFSYYQQSFESRLSAPSRVRSEEVGEREAQLFAIAQTFDVFFSEHPTLCVEIWNSLRAAHLKRKANIDFDFDENQINSVISAGQSWVKSSGHAAESFFAIHSKPYLQTHGIEFILQKDMTKLLSQNRLDNAPRDLLQLASWADSGAFDLYAVTRQQTEGRYALFGCIQSKTSIRDRVTRDREPSILAMSHFFWSVALVIDGTFLGLPKFQSMVNGGSDSFQGNGWHGMYALSSPYIGGRIFTVDEEFKPLIDHAIQAREQYLTQRQWFNATWRPKDIQP